VIVDENYTVPPPTQNVSGDVEIRYRNTLSDISDITFELLNLSSFCNDGILSSLRLEVNFVFSNNLYS